MPTNDNYLTVEKLLAAAIDMMRREMAVEPFRDDEFLCEFLGEPVVLREGCSAQGGELAGVAVEEGLLRAKSLGIRFHPAHVPLAPEFQIRKVERPAMRPERIVVVDRAEVPKTGSTAVKKTASPKTAKAKDAKKTTRKR